MSGSPNPGDRYFQYDQPIPSTVWIIDHNLGRLANVTLINDAGMRIFGDLSFPTLNKAIATFVIPVAGSAIAS